MGRGKNVIAFYEANHLICPKYLIITIIKITLALEASADFRDTLNFPISTTLKIWKEIIDGTWFKH